MHVDMERTIDRITRSRLQGGGGHFLTEEAKNGLARFMLPVLRYVHGQYIQAD